MSDPYLIPEKRSYYLFRTLSTYSYLIRELYAKYKKPTKKEEEV